jgi:membrane fusion protein
MLLRRLAEKLMGRRQAPRPASMMDRFEVAGLHDLSSSIEFRRDTAASLMALFFLALGLFLIASMWIGSFSKQETMRGIVIGAKGGQTITATVDGTVSKVWVQQGAEVEAGQPLLTIVPHQSASGSLSISQNDVRSLEKQRDTVRQQSDEVETLLRRDEEDFAAFVANLDSIERNLREQEAEVEAALDEQVKVVRRMREFLRSGYATRESLSAQERLEQEFKRQLSDIRLQITQLDSSRLERRRSVAQNRSASAGRLAELNRAIFELEARIGRARTGIATDIISVTAGTIAAINVREGAEVRVGDTIGAIGDPEAPIRIGLQAPSKTMGLLSVGQRVVLKYDAFPYKSFGVKYGRIVEIGTQPLSIPDGDEQQQATLNPAIARMTRSDPPQSRYMIEVEPEEKAVVAYGVERPILIGSTLSADVIVERRKLIEWVLDPILAMRGRT